MANREVFIFLSVVVIVVALLASIITFEISPFFIALAAIVVILAAGLSPRLMEFKEYERGVMFRFGKFRRVAGPGWIFYWPAFETFILTDLRVSTVDLPKQHVITRDDVEIKVDAVIYEKVVDSK